MKKIYFLFFVGLMISIQTLFAQNQQPDYRKLHYLSKEEMEMKVNLSKNFVPTDPPEGVIRNVAEFDEMQAVLVRYPFGVPVELIREMAENTMVTTIVANSGEQQTVINTYTNSNVNLSNCNFIIAPTDSYWVRDYGPWFIFDGNKQPGIVDFPYNRPRPNDNNIPAKVSNELGINLFGMNLISTGGNYMCDGMGFAASTDLVWDENPTLTHTQISDYVHDYLGNTPYMVLEDPLGEYIKHIDCWGKYLSPGKVIIGQVPATDPRYQDYENTANYFATTNSSWGYPYEVVRVYTPGTYPNTPYTNSLILNKKVFVPITGSQWDDEALVVYEEAMPGYEIVGVMYNSWENTDALHCRTKGIADLGMLYIKHLPLLGNFNYSDHFNITADIIAYSGETVYPDSVFVYFRQNGSDYEHTLMQHVSGDTYSGTIENVQQGATVEYYLFAADESGRRSFCPYIGEPDPFEFHVATLPVLSFSPDSVLFQTEEEMMNGLPLHIVNNSSGGFMISSLTEMGDAFEWVVDQVPQMPLILPSSDSISLLIKCNIPVKYLGTLITDSLFVTTGTGVFAVRIMIDSDLISSIDDPYSSLRSVVYPNPASTKMMICLEGYSGKWAQVNVYRLSGELMLHQIIKVSGNRTGVDFPDNMMSGTYIYQVIAPGLSTSGKVIVIR
ncbi:MAG: agmatine deiminase family protein [Bacteroidales bacterium]|nr:agmatine deiminase family protein [Bacteroidales bacterium]